MNKKIFDYVKKFNSLDIYLRGYLIIGIFGYLFIFSMTHINTQGLMFFSIIFSFLLVSPFIIKKCLYIVVYTITKAINDAKNNQPNNSDN